MKKVVIDIDELLLLGETEKLSSVGDIAESIERFSREGYSVVLTCSQSSMSGGNRQATPDMLLKGFRERLSSCSLRCDELILGKPEVDEKTLVIDDKAITHKEFTTLNFAEITKLLEAEALEVQK